ncbi:hypothetical protein ACTWQF_04075 [Streptomyces sp. 8N114]|uniref:hypothetical protein n=1 Tax=Streptomyces sp. 8N114 TaxID=3457419 RepID=UPI003FCF6ABF
MTLLLAALVAAILAVSFAGSASAREIYEERASKSNAPELGDCLVVNADREAAGIACFEKRGDDFYIKDSNADGYHIEMRGLINSTNDGFRCYDYGGPKAGWQKCDSFSGKIPENREMLWHASAWDGKEQVSVAGPRISRTSE